MPDPEIYRLTLRSEGWNDVPANVRMRRLLKNLLRAWGFRCVRIDTPAEQKASVAPQSVRRDAQRIG